MATTIEKKEINVSVLSPSQKREIERQRLEKEAKEAALKHEKETKKAKIKAKKARAQKLSKLKNTIAILLPIILIGVGLLEYNFVESAVGGILGLLLVVIIIAVWGFILYRIDKKIKELI